MVRLVASVGIGIGAVYFWVNQKAKKRMALIEEQLPDAIELMVRSLRVGHPFTSAVQIVRTRGSRTPWRPSSASSPTRRPMAATCRKRSRKMAERLDMQDMRFLAVAVTIQQQSGGNLAEVLAGLSKVIRGPGFRLFRKVKAITAEAQWSGKFLSAFPLLCLIGTLLKGPHVL